MFLNTTSTRNSFRFCILTESVSSPDILPLLGKRLGKNIIENIDQLIEDDDASVDVDFRPDRDLDEREQILEDFDKKQADYAIHSNQVRPCLI